MAPVAVGALLLGLTPPRLEVVRVTADSSYRTSPVGPPNESALRFLFEVPFAGVRQTRRACVHRRLGVRVDSRRIFGIQPSLDRVTSIRRRDPRGSIRV